MPAPLVVATPSASHAPGDNGIELRVPAPHIPVPHHDAGPLSLLSLLRGSIAALARNDVAELHRLLDPLEAMRQANSGEICSEIAPIAAFIPTADLSEARRIHRQLGALLIRTERNLRLLRRASARSMAIKRNGSQSVHGFGTAARGF